MNKRTVRLLTDGLIAVVLTVLWRVGGAESSLMSYGVTVALGLLPFVWLALRHGGATAVVFAGVAGLINTFVVNPDFDFVSRLLLEVTPLLSSGLAGLFAKYTQKTLNNRRLSSTQLNIATASLLVSFVYFVIRYVLVPMTNEKLPNISMMSGAFWLSVIASAILLTVVLVIMARTKADLIIPKRSKYLSRKETSSLLND